MYLLLLDCGNPLLADADELHRLAKSWPWNDAHPDPTRDLAEIDALVARLNAAQEAMPTLVGKLTAYDALQP
jgi:hypothetical protein